jgi:uncharacterized repeat protein (TIGR01451 family)
LLKVFFAEALNPRLVLTEELLRLSLDLMNRGSSRYPHWMAICLFASLCLAPAATVFHDGFESGALSPAWTVSTSNNGRCLVTTNYGPAEGAWHLVLDDSVSDGLFSVAEATLQVNLTGRKNVMLTWKVKSLGNEPHWPGFPGGVGYREFDGVSLSWDGGQSWTTISSLAQAGPDWETYGVLLDYLAPFGWLSRAGVVQIRFSEYDNAPAPLDGIVIDEVLITADEDQRAVLELPTVVTEGGGPYTGYVMLAFAPTNHVEFELVATPTNQLQLPATVVIPAGQTLAGFEFFVSNDELVNLSREVSVGVQAPDTSGWSQVQVLDDEPLNATLFLPEHLVEGAPVLDNARLTLDRPPAVPLTWNLSQVGIQQLSFPYNVIIPAGQTQAVFTVAALDDAVIVGDSPVTLLASASGQTTLRAQTLVADNDQPSLSLRLPQAIFEGGLAQGTVRVSGILTTNLEIQLHSIDPNALGVPSKLMLPAGVLEVTFDISAADNALRDGSRLVRLEATAAGFPVADEVIGIRDNDAATYRFLGLTDIVEVDQPVSLTLQAADIEGNALEGLAGQVQLVLVLPDGSTQPVVPAAVTLPSSNGWAGTITLPPVQVAPLRLRASHSSGLSGDSEPFDISRTLDLKVADLAWDAQRDRLYATLPANFDGTNSNQLVTINPYAGLVDKRLTLAQDPGQIVLTSGGESLYVALDANGTVARVDPASLEVQSTFALGTSTADGTLFAVDLCPVAGQPNLLVVSRRARNSSFGSIAVYDNGGLRPKVFSGVMTGLLEPSPEPGFVFGFNTWLSPYLVTKLQIDPEGVTNAPVAPVPVDDYTSDLRADGHLLVTEIGLEVDGLRMRRVGSFPTRGPVCPKTAVNRVFFLERSSPFWWSNEGYDQVSSYDSTTLLPLLSLSLPQGLALPKSFIYWGTNGLACRTETNVILISSSRLVPTGPAADLLVSLQMNPTPPIVGTPLTYAVTVSNLGPARAENVVLTAKFSDYQAIQAISATQGSFEVTNQVEVLPSLPPYYRTEMVTNCVVSLKVGNLTANASATLLLTSVPTSAGSLTCTASAASEALEPDFSNNAIADAVNAGYRLDTNAVQRLRLSANNLLYDATRSLLWASTSSPNAALPGAAIFSINPVSGQLSPPIALASNLVSRCLALSGNGRYLYAALRDSTEVCRIDLESVPPTLLRIPLLTNAWGSGSYAQDIEVLDGDGTSFLVSLSSGSMAAVYDGIERRPNWSGYYLADRIERTSIPGLFAAVCTYISSYPVSLLEVNASGVVTRGSVNYLLNWANEIRGAEGLLLGSSGALVNSTNLTLLADFGVRGAPCLDVPNHRAYLVRGTNLFAFDTDTLLPAGSLPLPVSSAEDWAQACLRWGPDGLAILGTEGNIYIARWSSVPAYADSDSDGVPDGWELGFFGRLDFDLGADPDGDGISNVFEYLLCTSPVEHSRHSFQGALVHAEGQSRLRLVFTRRGGLNARPYVYEVSNDLAFWAAANAVSETVLSTQQVEGIPVETVEALVPASEANAAFVRLTWRPAPGH